MQLSDNRYLDTVQNVRFNGLSDEMSAAFRATENTSEAENVTAAFDIAVEEFLEHMDSLLLSKNEAYSTEVDRFYNFSTGSSILGCSREKTAWAYAAKHIASICKMVNDPDAYTDAEWLEKCGDLANYACLIYAMRKSYDA